MQEKQSVENTKHTNVRIPMNIYEEIETLAIENDRKVADQIRHMLKEYLRIKKG